MANIIYLTILIPNAGNYEKIYIKIVKNPILLKNSTALKKKNEKKKSKNLCRGLYF